MKQPSEPNKEDCCNSGCNPCIFDVYEKQLKLYKSYTEQGKTCKVHEENALSQLEYSSFTVVKNIDLCKQHRVLLFKKETESDNKLVFWNPGDHLLVQYSSVEHRCTRAYTPIKIKLEDKVIYDFAIIVKGYENGLVSNYLCNLNVGEISLWRGPYGQYQLDPDKFSRIVMVAQGTGIAPLFSILEYILNNEDFMTKIILFYCCQCLNTILLRDELYSLLSYWNFKYVIHLSKKPEKNSLKYHEPILTDKLTMKDLLDLKPFTEKDQFLLCGSDEFMKWYKNCLQQENIFSKNIVTF